MKKLIGFSAGLAAVAALALMAFPTHATMIVGMSLEETVQRCGKGSFWIDGSVIAAEDHVDPNGYPSVVITLSGELLKKSAVTDHLYFGNEWIKGSPGDQVTVDVKLFGSTSNRGVVREFTVPKVGQTGIFGFTGPGPGTANSGYCGTALHGFYEETTTDSGGKAYRIPRGVKALRLGSLKISGNENAVKSLGTLQRVTSGSTLPKADFKSVLTQVINQAYPGDGVKGE